ncbi:hypothetical protein CSIM01_02058 [Colletotrichum simmondsii]|uniref:Uncharacterized protein n=1 Tax=Colletotrichum simmondsii TaxID=703756 RepID=A0A135RZD3_9PEZI|nr:hypothetical protein CSIM01_02058 [Colletotrichum simmondsii]
MGIRDRAREAFGFPADLEDAGDGAAAQAVDTMPPDLIEYRYFDSSSHILKLASARRWPHKPCLTLPAPSQSAHQDSNELDLKLLSHRRNSDSSGEYYV